MPAVLLDKRPNAWPESLATNIASERAGGAKIVSVGGEIGSFG